jgi:hypothetical protein
VGSLSKAVIWFSCKNVPIFYFSASFCIMTVVLPLSAFAIVRLFCSSKICNCFRLYLCLLCRMLCVLISVICLIFLAARYLRVFCIFTSGYLMAFFVFTISALMKCFGFFLWRSQILRSTHLFLTEFYLYHVYKSCMEAMFHCFLLWRMKGLCPCNEATFFSKFLV